MIQEVRIQDYLNEHVHLFDAELIGQIGELENSLRDLRSSGGTAWVLGNGGSAASASHAVVDFAKTASSNGLAGIRSVAISEMISLQTAYANDVSFEDSFANSIMTFVQPKDLVLALSVSGQSPNLLKALSAAKNIGARTAGIFGLRGKEAAEMLNVPVIVKATDYQIVENLHMIIIHWLVKRLSIS